MFGYMGLWVLSGHPSVESYTPSPDNLNSTQKAVSVTVSMTAIESFKLQTGVWYEVEGGVQH